MTTPIPTPFDIIDPSPGALVPTVTAWFSLLVVSLIVCAVIAMRRRIPRAKSINARLQKLVDELRSVAAHTSTPQELERLARLSRRIISPYVTSEVSGMSPGDLRAAAATLGKSRDDNDRSLSEIIFLLAAIEEQTYAPGESISNASALSGSVEALVTRLENHVRRFRPL